MFTVWGLQKPDLTNNFMIGATQNCTNLLNRQLTQTTGANVATQRQVGPCNNANYGLEVF